MSEKAAKDEIERKYGDVSTYLQKAIGLQPEDTHRQWLFQQVMEIQRFRLYLGMTTRTLTQARW